jgi:hypothetical protein
LKKHKKKTAKLRFNTGTFGWSEEKPQEFDEVQPLDKILTKFL